MTLITTMYICIIIIKNFVLENQRLKQLVLYFQYTYVTLLGVNKYYMKQLQNQMRLIYTYIMICIIQLLHTIEGQHMYIIANFCGTEFNYGFNFIFLLWQRQEQTRQCYGSIIHITHSVIQS